MMMMIPCPACQRHLRDTEVACRFCGVDLRSSKIGATAIGAWALTMVVLGSSACSKDTTASETAGTTTSNTTVDTSETGMTTTETGTGDDGPDETTLTSGSFYAGPEPDYHWISECDPFAQDCPEGEKCVPYASGRIWDANKCVPITGDDATGEPCVSGGPIDASDSCDGSGACWDLVEVDGEWLGTCRAFCGGTADDPECPDETACVISNDGSITLCVQSCDPLVQDCPNGLGCYWFGDGFACAFAGAAAIGEPCGPINECVAGSMCAWASMVPECSDSRCCAGLCSLGEPVCSEPGTECVSLFDDPPPVGFEDVGICVVPG